MIPPISYRDSGVDIDNANATKRAMADSLNAGDPRVLNSFGAFASLVSGSFPGYQHPVLVCKTEEPGSKQLLAFQHDRIESVCEDMINHLINDIAVMGAVPLFVQDCIVCGAIEKEKVTRIVRGIAGACKAQGCVLTGGETSEQPGVLDKGTYVLTASVIGIVERDSVIDGSRIEEGNVVLALASSGLHTNGYTLVRKLLREKPEIASVSCGGKTFLDAVLEPHRCYVSCIQNLIKKNLVPTGIAHITGGGILGNLNRILPSTLNAEIDCGAMRVLPEFRVIRDVSGTSDADMIQTFNLGVGITLVCDAHHAEQISSLCGKLGIDCYPIGTIVHGTGEVKMEGTLQW